MTSPPSPITVIGAGLSGLTLGLCLKHKGIPAVIYDRSCSLPRHNYGISLYPAAYRPLLGILNLDEKTFRQKLAVDAQQGSTGTLPDTNESLKSNAAFRCNRGRLEALLGDGLAIKWNKRLDKVQLDSRSREITAHFDDEESLGTKCLIGCDGPHAITRQSLSPTMKFEILPYAVINGKRRMDKTEYTKDMQKYLRESEVARTRTRQALLEISINDITESHVDVNYIYSRPAYTDTDDALYKPNRPMSGAKDIPEEFFEEVEALHNLESPFREIFVVDKVRQDRLLHWLMRSLPPDQEEADRLAGHGVILIGDAIHLTPILGGDGANMAIKDGLDLAEHIATHGTNSFQDFSRAKIKAWLKSVDGSKTRIRELHSFDVSNL